VNVAPRPALDNEAAADKAAPKKLEDNKKVPTSGSRAKEMDAPTKANFKVPWT